MTFSPASGCCWITGASSGLGRALALEMAAQGWQVAASARREDLLQSLADDARDLPGHIRAWPIDVQDSPSLSNMLGQIEQEMGPIALAVLNAGTHEPTDCQPFRAEPYRRLIDLNLLGTVKCLEAVLPALRRQGRGQVAVVASLAGYFGLPGASAYALTKAGLIAMAQSLQPELARDGITLQIVNPGFVRTPLTDKNDFPMPFLMEPEAAAQAFYRGLAGGRFEITFPKRLAWCLRLLQLLPQSVALRLTRLLLPKDKKEGQDDTETERFDS
ncbi:MAG: SDR family NAD(P)-dependent oxidoreductase [Pseudomonadota bacterium]